MAALLRIFLFFSMFTMIQANAYVKKVREAREYQQQIIEQRERELEQQEKQQQQQTKIDTYSVEINNKKKPEVIRVELTDHSEAQDLGKPSISDLYERDYMSSGVVGLVGVPVKVTYDENATPILTFYYDEDELRGIPERNLIILHETPDGTYEQVGQESLDEQGNSITVKIPEGGTYLMADRYQWYTCWGVDMSDYAYTVNPMDYKSDWERQGNTGSIMDLVDKQWVWDNAPEFHVSTPEQLAGVVYYNNALVDYSQGAQYVGLYLEADIDLAGYDWVPMGWSGANGNRYDGVVDGQGHTIKNMTINQPNESHVAFIGYSTGVAVNNINFENATIIGGGYTGIVGGEIYMSKQWENVNVSGTISNAWGEVGSIIGREAYLNFKNCTADVVYKDGNTERPIEYFSHRQELLANTPATEDFTLTLEKDGSVTRTTLENEADYRNLMWHLDVDGVQILQRGAENETNYDPSAMFAQYKKYGDHCTMWLDAFTGETYTRVSNILEYK